MNKVVHFELPADDLTRAKKFYSGIFGWKMNDYPEMNYVIAQTVEVDENMRPKEPGAINGGMALRGGNLAGPSFSINVRDIDSTLEKIRENGGEVLKEKTPVGKMGFVAYFRDTEDNVLSLWQNA
ncbi:VOC family protein [Candidatus Giovannonibacteria bacterium]|nr:VOC family protein [Candidatus Giovannonibacteria bacterium]